MKPPFQPVMVDRLRQAILINIDHFVQIIFNIHHLEPRRIWQVTDSDLAFISRSIFRMRRATPLACNRSMTLLKIGRSIVGIRSNRYAAATTSCHACMADALKTRCVLAEVRWHWTLKVL
jgi:hypothetical protein